MESPLVLEVEKVFLDIIEIFIKCYLEYTIDKLIRGLLGIYN